MSKESISIIIPTLLPVGNPAILRLLKSMETSLRVSETKLRFDVTLAINSKPSFSQSLPGSLSEDVANFLCDQLSFPVKVIGVADEGLVNARHAGISANPQSDFFSFLDDDVFVGEGFFNGLAKVVKSSILLATGSVLPNWLAEPPQWLLSLYDAGKPWRNTPALSIQEIPETLEVIHNNYVWGANFVVCRSVIDRCMGFHPDSYQKNKIILRGDGETHVANCALQHGVKARALSDLRVYHDVPTSRMTHEFFFYRAALEGVSYSFRKVRAGVAPRAELGLDSKTLLLNSHLSEVCENFLESHKLVLSGPRDTEQEKIAITLGFTWHQEACYKNPKLVDWCRRPHYFRKTYLTF